VALVALAAIVAQVVWLTRQAPQVQAGKIRPLRPERRGTA
jgi:hypothetical protein